MFKKITLLASAILPLSISQSFANWESFEEINLEEGGQRIHAVWKNPARDRKFFLRSAGPDSFESYTETHAAEGYPAVERSEKHFKRQNVDRQGDKNPYHLYTLSFQIDGNDEILPLGFVQFSWMPSLGYPEGMGDDPTAYHPIIQNWMDFKITQQKDPEGGFDDDNLERIENRGLATILPFFSSDISQENRTGAVEACHKLVGEFTKRGKTLPEEGTLPYRVVSLFHPNDPNIAAFESNGFTTDAGEEFRWWFYPNFGAPQPRVMVTRLVEIE